MLNNPDCYINNVLEHIEDVRTTYNCLKQEVEEWPEQNLYKGDWSAIIIKFNYKFLKDTNLNPLLDVCPIAMFSVLKPNTEIKIHKGHKDYCEFVYRCHVCLENSENNVLVVDSNPYVWVAGQGFWFDDSKDHWGWNRGTKDRVILMFDIPKNLSNPPQMSEEMMRRFN